MSALWQIANLFILIVVPAIFIGIVVLFYIKPQRIEDLLREIRDSLGGRFPEA